MTNPSVKYYNAKDKLAIAIFKFYDSFPLYYYILSNLIRVENSSLSSKTLAVGFLNQEQQTLLALFYHPDFIMKHSINELVVALEHEVQHIGLKHLLRINNRDIRLMNIAMDVVVNYYIADFAQRAPKIYKLACTADKYPTLKNVNIRNSTTEHIYNLLKNDPEAQKQLNKGSKMHKFWVGVDKNGNPTETNHNVATAEQEAMINNSIKEAVKQLGDTHPGNIPGSMKRIIKELTTVKTNWKHYITLFAQTIAQEDQRNTWKKYNKRLKYVAPGRTKEFKPNLLVVLDNSGSTVPYYDMFMSHISKISKFIDITVIGVDTQVNFEYHFQSGKFPSNFKDTHSGGGTLFQPAFDYAKSGNFDGIVYLTDGYNFDNSLNTYHIPVLFAITPDGQKVKGHRNIILPDNKKQ